MAIDHQQAQPSPATSPGKGMNRKVVAWGIGMVLAGGFIGLVGLLLFLNRVPLAAAVLGANIVFGMPWAQADGQKVAVVALAGVGVMGLGGLGFVTGVVMALVQFAKGK